MDIVWVGFAFILGLLFSRISIPPLVGYLVAGLFLGSFNYEEGPLMYEISHLGVVFLLFTVGLHIKIKNIVSSEVLGVGLVHMLVSTLLFLPLCLYYGLSLEAGIIISIALGFSSTVLAAKNLEIRGELGAYYGRVAIGILILQDLVAIGLIAYSGGGFPSPWALLLLGLPLTRPAIAWILQQLHRDELLLLMAMALAIGGDSLFVAFNLSGELGALVMGMLLASDPKGEQLEKKIWGIKEAFLVGFFLQIGLIGFPDTAGFQFIGLALLLLPVKAALFFGLFMVFKLQARTGYQATVALTAYSEFTLIAGTVAISAGIVPESMISVLGLLVAVSYTLNAIFVKQEDRIWELMGALLSVFERKGKHPDREIETLGAAEYLVIGLGMTGRGAYDNIRSKGKPVVGMDIDPDRLEQDRADGRKVVYGDAQDIGMWENLNTGNLKAILIAMSGNIELKVHLLKLLNKCRFGGRIYVMTLNPREDDAVFALGGIPVSIPAHEVGKLMADYAVLD